MSTIPTTTNESVWKLYQFLGLNENPDGDTKLKMGEATVCRNWKVTRDRNLKKRPGLRQVSHVVESLAHESVGIRGMWFGNVAGEEVGLIATEQNILKFYEDGEYLEPAVSVGVLSTLEVYTPVNFFAYSNVVYILDGHDYYKYDGTELTSVVGYVPLVVISRAPDGADGQTLEEVNKLNGKRRVWFSPNGTSTVFKLPETGLSSIDTVTNTSDGSTISGITKNTTNGTVTFNTAPERGVNTIEIAYTVPDTAIDRSTVVGMTNAELYLGSQDDAVFLYGDGTNKAIYSGIDYDGNPSAEYFPDLNVITVADENTPITSMIRHNGWLVCYKTTSTYSISFGLITLADGNMKYGFYVTPVNKSIGNEALGQVQLVGNSPISLFGTDLYKWENASPYSAELTRDERMAIRISDRVHATLSRFDLKNCYCYDDNYRQEYYIWNKYLYHGKYSDAWNCYEALVWNYAADAWYTYVVGALPTPYTPFGVEISAMCNVHEDLVVATKAGRVYVFDEEQYYDFTSADIDCYFESGSIDFGKPYQRKFMSEMWVGMKPDDHSLVDITIMTDKKSEYTERTIKTDLLDFSRIDFSDFSFSTDRKPKIKKIKLKAKKFAFLKLVLKQNDKDRTATVLMIDPKIRETGYVK